MGLFAGIIGSSTLYNLGTKLPRLHYLLPRIGPLREWHRERELPEGSHERFRDWYRKYKEET
jgi:hypothetical protein